jgi:hypothetical protein
MDYSRNKSLKPRNAIFKQSKKNSNLSSEALDYIRRCHKFYILIQSDSLARGPMEVYLQIFNEFVNQLTDDDLTTGYYQKYGATCQTSNASM